MARRLLRWYGRHGRDLPWRHTREPYRIWVAEAMLQQTTVKTVVPHYGKFLARFPTLRALASAPLPDVLAAWSGLGYYRRARHLKAAAEIVTAERGGRLPEEPAALRRLPGFGPYMAASVASIAFDRPCVPVDANIRRVGARLLALGERGAALDRTVTAGLAGLFRAGRPSLVANALMDLGALVCLPAEPRCVACPLAPGCLGRAAPGRYGAAPPRARAVRRAAAAVAAVRDGRVWLLPGRARLLQGMWDLPHAEAASAREASEQLARLVRPAVRAELLGAPAAFTVRHSIMARRIVRQVYVLRVRLPPVAGGAWVEVPGAGGRPLSSTARRCLQRLDRLARDRA